MKNRFLRSMPLAGVFLIASWVAAQCGPTGCYVKPRQLLTPTASLPAGVRASLARIVHREGGGTSFGSGALVGSAAGSSYFVTCAHLFGGPGRTTVQNSGHTLAARIVAIDKQHDLALLETHAVASRPFGSTGDFPRGELIACGYGSTGQLRCVRGPVVGKATAVGASTPSLRIRFTVRSGDSGGPVLDASGRLVAVVWGARDGETFAMGGAPLQQMLSRVPRARVLPIARLPTDSNKQAPSDPWRTEIEQQIRDLGQRQPVQGRTLPKDVARHGDLRALSDRWQQRFDRLSTQVRSNAEANPRTESRNPFSLVSSSLLTALGIGGPIGIGLFVVKACLRRRSRLAKDYDRHMDDAGVKGTVVVDSPPPPQQVVPETHYVPYQRDDFARAHQWASEQLVRKFPGSVEMLASLDSLIRQQLNGKEAP